ncbi:MAG: helix-turn-helix transcriptional regulator [Bacteroidota bacterium]|nr:helix-turn-helix transcriptional regulator [Bacteroidota bacterium]
MKQSNTFLPLSFGSEKDELPFRMRTLECMVDNIIDENSYARSHNQFVVIFITGGSGSLSIDFEKTTIKGNHLLIVKPCDFHRLRLSNGIKGYVMSFLPSFFDASDHGAEWLYDSVYQMFAETRLVSIEGDALTDIRDIMEIMLKEFTKHNLYRNQILKRYFNVFLIHLCEQFKTPAEATRQPRNNEILYNFMSLLEKYFRVKKMVADYADMLYVTPNYLNEVIKKLTGISAGCQIRKRIALEAKRQAVYSNSCMKSIAYDLGFLDLSHFSKFFKNTTGINFSDFKKNGVLLQPLN